jgi:alpha-ketoglutarate-dependent taurine dioxygenase
MRPAISPENIYAHRHDEQDVVLWYNRALWHSIVSGNVANTPLLTLAVHHLGKTG